MLLQISLLLIFLMSVANIYTTGKVISSNQKHLDYVVLSFDNQTIEDVNFPIQAKIEANNKSKAVLLTNKSNEIQKVSLLSTAKSIPYNAKVDSIFRTDLAINSKTIKIKPSKAYYWRIANNSQLENYIMINNCYDPTYSFRIQNKQEFIYNCIKYNLIVFVGTITIVSLFLLLVIHIIYSLI